ncbi:MAG: carboxypeptidase regulatory-like domain-containing protein, partial [Bryobacterales bacterium]|nr:carboxypeptidase regulatory-like domain-containing protein [Bryobacterales bacterium]
VAVRITNLDTNQSQQGASNETGDFTIPYLAPGRYSLEAKVEGFRLYRRSEFVLAVDQVQRIDIAMEIGATTESVTVTEAPPVLNTETGARGDVTTNAEITEMPLAGRNFSDLAYLTGGVLPKGEDGDGAYAINGARADNVGFLVDGMNNTQRRNTGAVVSPPIEGIQEFKMITSGFSAEYGRYAGGVLSVVMKSGTNRFRGSLYEFIRNDLIDARGFFEIEKSKLRRNQFGATLSGPVMLPKLYNGRDKTFFLVTWESLRQVAGTTQRGIVPQPEMMSGDFTKAVDSFGRPLRITDPLARALFPDNKIPASRLDPVSAKLGAFYPSPNLTGTANNYIGQANSNNVFDNFSI